MVIKMTGGMNALKISGAISPFGTFRRSGGSGGARFGLMDASDATKMRYMADSKSPGPIAAMNTLPTET